MDKDTSLKERRATVLSWIIVAAIAIAFLCWGLTLFFTVGDKGPPPWHFGVVEDIPGQSPYSTERALDIETPPQHVAE